MNFLNIKENKWTEINIPTDSLENLVNSNSQLLPFQIHFTDQEITISKFILSVTGTLEMVSSSELRIHLNGLLINAAVSAFLPKDLPGISRDQNDIVIDLDKQQFSKPYLIRLKKVDLVNHLILVEVSIEP
jgi:hypothetical protein